MFKIQVKIWARSTACLCVAAMTLFGSALADGLKPGSQGKQVEALQKELQKQGYYSSDEITGFYGIVTEQSVKKYQKKNSLREDGIAGEVTLKLLFGKNYEKTFSGSSDKNEKAPSATPTPEPKKNKKETPTPKPAKATEKPSSSKDELTALYSGCENDDVMELQKQLKKLGYYTETRYTGYFGPATEKAVMNFQMANSIKADGIAGDETQKRLFSSRAVASKAAVVTAAVKKATPTATPKPAAPASKGDASADKIINYAKNFLGTPYRYGRTGPDAFDCSGFTWYVFKNYGVSIERTSKNQGYGKGSKIDSINNLEKGDLVFFDTTGTSDRCGHVGIYIGDGKFIHCSSASSGKYVRISSLSSGYYNLKFTWGRRIL